jgi:rRNA maturation endonuclease Nob1
MIAYPELYECRSCYHTGPLSEHGRCERCGSDSVLSVHKINHRSGERLTYLELTA